MQINGTTITGGDLCAGIFKAAMFTVLISIFVVTFLALGGA